MFKSVCELGPISNFRPGFKYSLVVFLIMGSVALAFGLLSQTPAYAATITVSSTADDATAGNGQCTLREAINNANAAGDTTGGDCVAGTTGTNTINFSVS